MVSFIIQLAIAVFPTLNTTLSVWCRAGLRRENLSVYTDFFYEPQTLENL